MPTWARRTIHSLDIVELLAYRCRCGRVNPQRSNFAGYPDVLPITRLGAHEVDSFSKHASNRERGSHETHARGV